MSWVVLTLPVRPWGRLPSFFHLTVVPGATTRTAGLSWDSVIETWGFWRAAGAAAGKASMSSAADAAIHRLTAPVSGAAPGPSTTLGGAMAREVTRVRHLLRPHPHRGDLIAA